MPSEHSINWLFVLPFALSIIHPMSNLHVYFAGVHVSKRYRYREQAGFYHGSI